MCTHPRTAVLVVEKSASSSRAIPQHTEKSVYRCYLPVLTGFTGFCCTGPSLQHHLTNGQPKQTLPSGGSSTPVERIPGYRAPLTPHLAHRTLLFRRVLFYVMSGALARHFPHYFEAVRRGRLTAPAFYIRLEKTAGKLLLGLTSENRSACFDRLSMTLL